MERNEYIEIKANKEWDLTERDGIYRKSILEHFLPISKQTPKPSASIEC